MPQYTISNPNGLLLDWKPATEAEAFLHLIHTKQLSIVQAKQQVLMTPTQAAWLIEQKVGSLGTIQTLMQLRIQTWTMICESLREKSIRVCVHCRELQESHGALHQCFGNRNKTFKRKERLFT